MSDQINQIQATYQANEDRILLNIKTTQDNVYTAWITRRFMQLLIPVLHGQHPTTGEAMFDDKTSHIHQAEKEQTQLKGNYDKAYVEPEEAHYPLGETPLLLAKLTFKNLHSEQAQLLLEPEKGQGIIVPYHPNLLGPLIKIFAQALHNSDWNLELNSIMAVPEQARLQ